MERLPRFTIYLGIAIGVIVFSMFLYAVIPGMIQNTGDEWERTLRGTSDSSEEDLMALFTAHPIYIAFYEVYPDAKEEFQKRNRGNGNLSVGIMNFTTGDQIVLEMHYNKRDDRMNVNVRCNIMGDEDRRNDNFRAEGLFAEDFIRNTDCIGMAKQINDDGFMDKQYLDGPRTLESQNNMGQVEWLEASYPASGTGVVRVIDPDMNLNPEAVDNFDVDVWSDSDAGGITLTVTETNEATGIFEGTVFFTTTDKSSGHRLKVSEGDTITAEYEDHTLPYPYTSDDRWDIVDTAIIRSIPLAIEN